jgi:hypothetical protein
MQDDCLASITQPNLQPATNVWTVSDHHGMNDLTEGAGVPPAAVQQMMPSVWATVESAAEPNSLPQACAPQGGTGDGVTPSLDVCHGSGKLQPFPGQAGHPISLNFLEALLAAR